MILGKKHIIITLAIALLFTLAVFGGCAKKAVEPGPTDQVVTLTPEPEPALVEYFTSERATALTLTTTAPAYVAFDASNFGDVFFAFDKSDLTAVAKDTLANNAALLKVAFWGNIVVEGYCDERGTNEYNLGLGERRANTVKNYLVSMGISTYRIKTISYGEEKPFAMGHNEAAWEQNRRAHFSLQR